MAERTKYTTNPWGSIALYAAIFMIVLLPYNTKHWPLVMQASIILGLFLGCLNELLQQIRKLVDQNKEVVVRMTKDDGTPYTDEEIHELVRNGKTLMTKEESLAAADAFLRDWKAGRSTERSAH